LARLIESILRRPREQSAAPVRSRDISSERPPADGGLEGFETPDAHAINEARLRHLESLGLAIEGKRVLDVGSGPGHLAQFFVERGCSVVSTDARTENIDRLRNLYPALESHVMDVETGDFNSLGRFEVVFCYGLLYHVENPLLALRNICGACDGLILLETMVCDSSSAILRLEDEYLSLNQALRGVAHRPSPAWVAMAFDRIGFHHVYTARTPPRHPDYEFARVDSLETSRDGHLLRAIFVASRTPLTNNHLLPLVLEG
jgi:SAM-dependent methyltransferase